MTTSGERSSPIESVGRRAVTVRLEDGSVRTLQQGAQPPFAVGDRVRIVDGSRIERA